jgi:hypothetical protein
MAAILISYARFVEVRERRRRVSVAFADRCLERPLPDAKDASSEQPLAVRVADAEGFRGDVANNVYTQRLTLS